MLTQLLLSGTFRAPHLYSKPFFMLIVFPDGPCATRSSDTVGAATKTLSGVPGRDTVAKLNEKPVRPGGYDHAQISTTHLPGRQMLLAGFRLVASDIRGLAAGLVVGAVRDNNMEKSALARQTERVKQYGMSLFPFAGIRFAHQIAGLGITMQSAQSQAVSRVSKFHELITNSQPTDLPA